MRSRDSGSEFSAFVDANPSRSQELDLRLGVERGRDHPRAGPRRARGRGRGSGRRIAASRARRGRRRRRSSARPSAATLTNYRRADAQADDARADAARDDRPVVAQPHGQPVHPHARAPAACLRERPLRARVRRLLRDDARGRAVAADRPARPAARARRRGGALPQPDRLRLRAPRVDRLGAGPAPRRDADLRRDRGRPVPH